MTTVDQYFKKIVCYFLVLRWPLLLAALGTFLVVTSTAAMQSDWKGDPNIVEARLLSAVNGTGDLTTLPLAVEFRLAADWKIYWRTPGEAGLPPKIDFSGSTPPNLSTTIRWPVPKRFDVFGFDNFGYESQLILPLDLTGHPVGTPAQISAQLEVLACSEICIPVKAQLDLLLPDGAATASSHAQIIARSVSMVPRAAGAGGRAATGPNLSIVSAVISGKDLILQLAKGAPPIDDIFVEGFDGFAFKAPVRSKDLYRLPISAAEGMVFDGGPALLTILAGSEMAEFHLTIPPRIKKFSAGRHVQSGVLTILAIAFLGGVILNLMPCVLPVLAMKLSAVLNASGRTRTKLRMGFLAGAGGIVTSFALMALALVFIRQVGGQIGWGIQFQNPFFLGVMIVVVGLFALSLADIVTIPVPQFAVSLARHFGLTVGNGLAGDFLAGMLATVLATPCSAPFVGSAVTVALTGNTPMLFVIFLAMGLGLASPWLLVAMFPGLVALLPRPGRWMIWLKRGLALLLIGTMLWLGMILGNLLAPEYKVATSGDAARTRSINWALFDQEALAAHIAEGQVVFIDVTADWCITCKVNKTLVLDKEPVAKMMSQLQQAGILVPMRGDWTRSNEQIANLLASHNRFGIPFNIVYGPALPDGYLLPELLTSTAVTEALELVMGPPK